MYPTEFPRNQWYVAGRSSEITRELLSRWFLGEPVCLYRGVDGAVNALVDRCIHRQMPLSKGTLHGDSIECGYHGILFGADGVAQRIPSQLHVPPACRVKRFATFERWHLVWIWMGDPELADESLIPDHHWLDDPDWAVVSGTLHLEGRAQLLNENLLDLSHLSFLHAGSIGTAAVAEVPITTTFDDRSVQVTRVMKGIDCPPTFEQTMKISGTIDRTQEASFCPPGFHTTNVSARPMDGDGRLYRHTAVHCVTPESRTTAHYFWCHARDYHIDDAEVSRLWAEGSTEIFRQDVDAVEAIEGIISAYEPSYPTELNMKVDAGPLRARRMIEAMVRAERAQDDGSAGDPDAPVVAPGVIEGRP